MDYFFSGCDGKQKNLASIDIDRAVLSSKSLLNMLGAL